MRQDKKGAVNVSRIAQPYSLQAEEAIIGALLTDPHETYAVIGDQLKEDVFYDPFARAAFSKSMSMLGKGDTPDYVTLSANLEAVIDMTQDEIHERFLRIVDTYPSTANLKNWTQVIVAKAIERNMAAMGERMMQMAHAQEVSPEEKLAEASRLLANVGTSMSSNTIVPATDMVASTMQMIEENFAKGGGVTGTKTGFVALDNLTSGYQPGDLIIVAARPSMGKTSFALSSGESVAACPNLEERRGVMMFSMEMGKTQIGMRWLALRKDVPLAHMRGGNITQDEWGRLRDALVESPETPFYLEESASLTIEQVTAKARRLHREKGFSLLIIDYLQLIEIDPNKSRTEGVSAVSRALKQLARELEVPVIALSQLNRTLEQRQDKRPMMSDLRESGAIEQDADIIMFVYRDEVYNPNSVDKGIAEIIIAKQRNGGLGTVRLAFDGPTTRFHEGASRFAT